MSRRMLAVQTQTEELWRIPQICGTHFSSLAFGVNYAYERGYINAAERARLIMVNTAANDAKHNGLGAWSRTVTPGGPVARAGSRCPPAVARATLIGATLPEPARAKLIGATLLEPWGPCESRPAGSGV